MVGNAHRELAWHCRLRRVSLTVRAFIALYDDHFGDHGLIWSSLMELCRRTFQRFRTRIAPRLRVVGGSSGRVPWGAVRSPSYKVGGAWVGGVMSSWSLSMRWNAPPCLAGGD